MSRYFALPVLATMLALVGLRLTTAAAPAEEPLEIVVSLPIQEPEAPAPRSAPAPQAPAPPAPRPEPIIIVLEPLPAPVATPEPVLKTEVVEHPIQVTQTTIVNTTTNNYYPVYPVVVEPQPEPAREVVEYPVAVFVCAAHRRAGCCLPAPHRRAVPKQDSFFKTIPFMPPTPRSPRFNP